MINIFNELLITNLPKELIKMIESYCYLNFEPYNVFYLNEMKNVMLKKNNMLFHICCSLEYIYLLVCTTSTLNERQLFKTKDFKNFIFVDYIYIGIPVVGIEYHNNKILILTRKLLIVYDIDAKKLEQIKFNNCISYSASSIQTSNGYIHIFCNDVIKSIELDKYYKGEILCNIAITETYYLRDNQLYQNNEIVNGINVNRIIRVLNYKDSIIIDTCDKIEIFNHKIN